MTDLGLEKTYCDVCNFEFPDSMTCFIHENECHSSTVKLSVLNSKGQPATVIDITQEDDGTYACKNCCVYFSNSRALQLHLTSKCMKPDQENIQQPFTSNSGFSRSSEDDFITNIAAEDEPPSYITLTRNKTGHFICPNCDATFTCKGSIRNHLEHTCVAHKETNYCNLCDNSFPYMRSLRDHYDGVHVEVIKIYDPTYNREIEVERSNSGVFFCPTCDQGYKLATAFKNHVRYPCKKTDSLELCDICNRYFDGTSGLTIHKYNFHFREIVVKGMYLKDLERELGFVRDDDEDFSCPACVYTTKNSSKFKAHVHKKPCRAAILKKASKGKRFNGPSVGKKQEISNRIQIEQAQNPPSKKYRFI